jgi:hypothetical protein
MRIRMDLLPNVAGSKMSARVLRTLLKQALKTPWWERHLRLINTMRKEISTQDRTLEVANLGSPFIRE